MPKFTVPGNKGGASVRTIVAARCDGTTLAKGKIYEYGVGAVASADASFDHEIFRVSTAGTGAAVTPSPNDPDETASISDAIDTVTVDPTIGVILYRHGMHQRASWRWVAGPGDELIWPNTANNGIGGGLAAASAIDFSGTLLGEFI